MNLDEAIRSAEALAAELKHSGDTPAYAELDRAIRSFRDQGYPIESILPQGADSRLGFSMRKADGRGFFEIYADLLRKNLCKPDGEFNKLIKSGVNSSVGVVMTIIVTTLGIPAVALAVIAPVAAIIANLGLDAFCEIATPE